MFSLFAATAYGVGDFFGALATRRSHPIWVSFIGHLFYTLIAFIGLTIFGGIWSSEAGVWGIATGASEAIGFLVFYFALNLGNVSLVAPLVSVIYASVPIVWGLVTGAELNQIQMIGLVIGIIAVVALSGEKNDASNRQKGFIAPIILTSLISGIVWGFSTVALSYVPALSGMVPVLVAGLTALVLITITLAITRGNLVPQLTRTSVIPAIWSGALFGLANLFIISALRFGSLTLVGLLTALYPLATVVLARIVLKEKISSLRWVGIGLALTSAILLNIR